LAHVELSLSELAEVRAARTGVPAAHGGWRRARGGADALQRWALAVTEAAEACLLLESSGVVVAASPSGAALFAVGSADAVGRHLLDGVLRLLDFNAVSGELPGWEVDKIPPLIAMGTGGLARGLLRVAAADGVVSTLDAISTPVRDGAVVVGSLTFFAPVGR
jgi:hypothetical protein